MPRLASLKQLGTESLIYGVSGIVTRFLSVFLIPLYARVFDAGEVGLVSVVTNLLGLLTIITVLGLDSSAGRWYYDTEDESERRTTLSTFLWTYFALSGIAGLAVFILRNEIARWLGQPDSAALLSIGAILLPITVFTAFSWNLLRLQRRPVATVVFTATTGFTTLFLNYLFIVVFVTGPKGVFLAQLGASLVGAVGAAFLFRGTFAPAAASLGRLKEMLRFSLPLIPGALAFWIVNLSGAYFILASFDVAEVGMYQMGAAVASGMTLITGAFQMAWGPFAFSIHKQPEADGLYARTLLLYLGVTCSLGLALSLFSREILWVFTTEKYIGSFWVTILLTYNFIIVGLGYIASIGTGIAKNNYAFGISMVVSALLLILLSLILVPSVGKEGAAMATFGAQLIVPIAVFWHAQRLHVIPYEFGKAAMIFLTSFLAAILSLWTVDRWPLFSAPDVIVRAFILIAYTAGIAFFFRDEVRVFGKRVFVLLRPRSNAII